MAWQLRVARDAEKTLARLPARDRDRIVRALAGMQADPFEGDIVRLEGQPNTWRRRVGSHRIIFEVSPKDFIVDVLAILRRTSTTY
jgi:mRNA-degrading endonuclease RelE of RelBE toxin-antitoxin system